MIERNRNPEVKTARAGVALLFIILARNNFKYFSELNDRLKIAM
jgi:hypothetical protein